MGSGACPPGVGVSAGASGSGSFSPVSHAGFPTLSACVTTERRAGLLRWEGGERGGGVVRFRSRFALANSRALIYQIPYPTFGRRSGGRGSGDATSCGRWRGATIAERRVASDRSEKRGQKATSKPEAKIGATRQNRGVVRVTRMILSWHQDNIGGLIRPYYCLIDKALYYY